MGGLVQKIMSSDCQIGWVLTSGQTQKRAQLLISKRVRVFVSYVRVCAQIIMKMNMLVDKYIESLSFKFYDDPLIGCGEIAKTKPSMHTYHF